MISQNHHIIWEWIISLYRYLENSWRHKSPTFHAWLIVDILCYAILCYEILCYDISEKCFIFWCGNPAITIGCLRNCPKYTSVLLILRNYAHIKSKDVNGMGLWNRGFTELCESNHTWILYLWLTFIEFLNLTLFSERSLFAT